jgi:hypothetical protein
MNIGDYYSLEDLEVTKEPPSFYYDSGLEENIHQLFKIKLENCSFISEFFCRHTGEIVYKGDYLERYDCNSYIEVKKNNLRYDFRFLFLKNMANNTYYIETSPELTFLQFPEDKGGVIDYYYMEDIMKLMFFNPPTFTELYY